MVVNIIKGLSRSSLRFWKRNQKILNSSVTPAFHPTYQSTQVDTHTHPLPYPSHTPSAAQPDARGRFWGGCPLRPAASYNGHSRVRSACGQVWVSEPVCVICLKCLMGERRGGSMGSGIRRRWTPNTSETLCLNSRGATEAMVRYGHHIWGHNMILLQFFSFYNMAKYCDSIIWLWFIFPLYNALYITLWHKRRTMSCAILWTSEAN